MASFYSSAGGFVADKTAKKTEPPVKKPSKQLNDDDNENYDPRPAYNREMGVYVAGLGRDWVAEAYAEEDETERRKNEPFIVL